MTTKVLYDIYGVKKRIQEEALEKEKEPVASTSLEKEREWDRRKEEKDTL